MIDQVRPACRPPLRDRPPDTEAVDRGSLHVQHKLCTKFKDNQWSEKSEVAAHGSVLETIHFLFRLSVMTGKMLSEVNVLWMASV